MPAALTDLSTAIDSDDAAGAGKLGHKIKGAAANVGGEALRETASQMEQAGKRGELAAVQRLLPELRKRYQELEAAARG